MAAYRTPADVKEEFRAHPRRALILTTVVHESRAVKAHLTGPERLIGEKGGLYEYGCFSDPAGNWLVVHVITPQGNIDAGLVATRAHQDFGSFHAQMFVGIAGSLKEDIPIGSVVIGDYVYNGHSAKVEDAETLGRPHGLAPARELLTASQGLIYSGEWIDMIRAPAGTELPHTADYPCAFPPFAIIKGIVSGEEVVVGGNSARYHQLRSHFDDCGAVEMEGWGAMSAARYENTPAIIVRGVSDMCAGKNHAKDKLHQPIAAAHAAGFAFSILSFRSKVPVAGGQVMNSEPRMPEATPVDDYPSPIERRVEFVFSFEGSKADWPQDRVDSAVERLKEAINDATLTLIRIEVGSVRLVMSVRERDVATMDMANLRKVASDGGFTLLGAAPLQSVDDAEKAKKALAAASVDLLAWERTLPNGAWMDRPERESIEARFHLDASSTVLLGEPGSGKSALLSRIASDLLDQDSAVFALKADLLSTDVRTEADLQRELQLPAPPSELVLRLAAMQPVFVLIDQLDALASQLDLRSGRLNVFLNLVRRIGGAHNVHILLSARTFEFNHDVRLRAVEAEAVTLALPPWHQVKERLAEVGVDPDAWPEKARDVVRIPQALKTFIALVGTGRSEPFTTYQAMLEQLWRDRIASVADNESLAMLASELAGRMADEETLWLAASRFDNQLVALERLESLRLIVRSENNLSVSFSHQTVFDYVLARTFVRSAGLLSKYVLDRQDSLFVRPKVWSALNYLREAEERSYEREFLEIWEEKELRRHLRLLLVEFLGQVRQPLPFEIVCMTEALNTPELRVFGLKAIKGSAGWFIPFASTAIRDAMVGSDVEAGHALQLLAMNWRMHGERVTRLIKEHWLPDPERDTYSWMAVHDCPDWTSEVEEIAATILKRTPISSWQVNNTAATVAVEQPDVAMRFVRIRLDVLLAEAKRKPAPPPFPVAGTDAEQVSWHIEHRPTKSLEGLLDAKEWNDLESLAETTPTLFFHHLWSWYVAVFTDILAMSERDGVNYVYPGQFILEMAAPRSRDGSLSRDKPVTSALQIAVEELAVKRPAEFAKWADENSHLEILFIQQLIARGYEVAREQLASAALGWLIADHRRFQLGSRYGHRHTTIALVQACAPRWSNEEITALEKAVLSYRPPVPAHLKTPEDRKLFADSVRATRMDLLEAVGTERLTPESRDLVAVEQRALGDRFGRSMSEPEGGWIGSPMDATSMDKAKDRDILKIFREIPDDTRWDHPRHWMRGGNVQLSRAFAEFARSSPSRAVRLMEQFEPLQQERAAGHALDAMADDALNDSCVLESLADLHNRGFQSEEFKDSAARALEKIASRRSDITDEIIGILVKWLNSPPSLSDEDFADIELRDTDTEDRPDESILWGYRGGSLLPNGNFNVLSALAAILLDRKEVGRDRFLAILDDHFSRERDPNVWKALLYRLSNAGGSTPHSLSTFIRRLFSRFPAILSTREAIIFLAYAQRWDDQLVFDLIFDWPKSDNSFLRRSYGELVGLVSGVTEKNRWTEASSAIIASGSDDMKIGLAHSTVNLWADEDRRPRMSETLVALLERASKELVATVMDVFRINEEFAHDASTVRLLRALADAETDLSAAPYDFVVERLQGLLPHQAELVGTIAAKLVAAWRNDLGDLRTGAVFAAPQLTDLALTLHRLGGASRQVGITLFEAMIEIDAYGARETLVEIDGRFGPQQAVVRRRLARRRRSRSRRR